MFDTSSLPMDPENELRRAALRRLVGKLGRGGIARIAKDIGVVPSYVSRMLSDPGSKQHRPITGDTVIAISRNHPGWFDAITLETPPETGRSRGNSLAPEAENQTLDQTPRMLNVLDWNDAPRHDTATPIGQYYAPPQCKAGAYWLQMRDDSMRETLPPGAMLLIEPFDPGSPIEADTAYVIQTPVGVVCRRAKAGVSGWMLVQEDGRNAPPEPLTDAVRIVGEVAMLLKPKP